MPHHAAYNVPLSELDVAVVDDIPHMTDLFRLMLGAVEVARVRTYNDPMKFLDVCRHDPPHLLITDLAMKPMNGAQLIHLVRREFMDAFCLMAILAVSAHAAHENIERTLACGANDFLVKPLSANMLCERLRRLTEDSRQLYLSDDRFVVEGFADGVLPGNHGQPGHHADEADAHLI